MKLISTGSQTIGPFFSIGLSELCQQPSTPESAPAGTITITGKLFDGDQKPIPDAVFEFWSKGQFVRVATTEDGSFSAVLRKPSDTHCFDVLIFMRGLLRPVSSRVYFGAANNLSNDECLQQVPNDRTATLLARPGTSASHFLWDVRMQGENETVFFDF